MPNQKKKILIIITKSNFGGAQKYVYELAKNLPAEDFEVKVALGGTGILMDKLNGSDIETFSIPTLKRDVSLLDEIKTFVFLFKLIKQYKPDIVHLNSSKIGGLGGLVSRMARVPKIIFTIHGWAFNEPRNKLSKLVIKIIYSFTLLFAHHSIAVSDTVRKQTKQLPFYFLFKNKITLVHNGVESINFLDKNEALQILGEKINYDLRGYKIVGQIAELHPIKSIETTIQAAQNIKVLREDIKFVIIGDGDQKDYLEQLIEKNNLTDTVFLTGFVDNAARYLKAFDVFCLTSLSEALALVLLETGHARVPLIATEVGGIPEVITDKESGYLFKPKDFKTLEKLILQTLDTDHNKMVQRLYNKVTHEFSIEQMVQKTIEVYTK